MQDWVIRAMQRWPNVPALFGWLGLSRKGRWLIKNEVITHPRIITAINENYAVDPNGRWYFQNGPQRGYIQLESAPLVLHVEGERLVTHTGRSVMSPTMAYLDEEGAVLIATEHGPGEIVANDLDWVLQRLTVAGRELREDELVAALTESSGRETKLRLALGPTSLAVTRLDFAAAPGQLNFDRDPQPRDGEVVSTRAMD
jgi:hypothetical protein